MNIKFNSNKNLLNFDFTDGYVSFVEKIHCWGDGYFFIDNELYFKDKATQKVLNDYLDNEKCVRDVQLYNGNFVFVVLDEIKRILTVITDRVGTNPLYYHNNSGIFIISNNFWWLSKQVNCRFNLTALSQLLIHGFVLGSRTMNDNIEQLQNHRIYRVKLSKDLVFYQESYWEPREAKVVLTGEDLEHRRDLIKVFEKIFSRMDIFINKVSQGSTILLLSGGLDTRIIAYFLKKLCRSVSTLTFGVRFDEDIIYAKRLAELLGWENYSYLIEPQDLLDDNLNKLTKILGMEAQYIAGVGINRIYNHNLTSSHIFLTGFGGDLISGSFIKDNSKGNTISPSQYILKYFGQYIKEHNFIKLFKDRYSEMFKQSKNALNQTIVKLNQGNNYDIVQNWNFNERQRRLILSQFRILPSNYTYLPFTDNEFLDFFNNLPLSKIRGQKLYINTLYFELFKDSFVNLRKLNSVKYHYGFRWHPISGGLNKYKYFIVDAIKEFNYYKQRLGLTHRPVEIYNYWLYDHDFREKVLDKIKKSEAINSLFKTDDLIDYLRKNRSYLMATGGIWSILTIASDVWQEYGFTV